MKTYLAETATLYPSGSWGYHAKLVVAAKNALVKRVQHLVTEHTYPVITAKLPVLVEGATEVVYKGVRMRMRSQTPPGTPRTLIIFDVDMESKMCDVCETEPCLESKSDGTADAIDRFSEEMAQVRDQLARLGATLIQVQETLETLGTYL